MGFISRTPKVDALARRGDVAAIVDAAGHSELRTGRDGHTVDVGIPIREAAIARLAEIGPGEGSAAVTDALADRSDRVRCAAVRTLCEWGEAWPLAAAVAWLPAEGGSRGLALTALAELDQPESAPVLAGSLIRGTAQEGLWDEELEVVSILCAAGEKRDALHGVLDVLIEALEDADDDDVADRAEDFLLWLGEAAAPSVTAALRHGAAPHRAAWILGQVGGFAAIEPLVQTLEHPDPRARAEACIALAELRDPASVEALLRASNDDEHVVRVHAAAALDRIGTVAVVAGVAALLRPIVADALASHADKPQVQKANGARARPRSINDAAVAKRHDASSSLPA